MNERRKYIKFHWPAIAGIPIVYQRGDRVTTRDGRKGVVVDYEFDDELILCKEKNKRS